MNIIKSAIANAKTLVNNTKVQVKTHLPEIALVGGVALTLAGTIYACKQTLKLNDILDDHHRRIDEINNVQEGAEYKAEDGTVKPYDDAAKVSDKICVYRDTTFAVCKIYILPAVLITVGEALKIYAFVSEKREAVKYATIANTALATLQQYRERWRDRVGDDEEAKVFYDRDTSTVTVMNDDGNGNTTTETINSTTCDIPRGQFSVIFSPSTSKMCDDNLRYMLPVLQAWEAEFNDRCFAGLNGGEIVELNRVLRFMGCKERGDWMTAGWVPRKFKGKVNHVSFGLDKYKKPIEEGGLDYEKDGYFILEFNCEYIDSYF